MGIVNCKSCGKIFNYVIGDKVCSECKKKIDNDFKRAKNYIRENRDAGIEEVSRECEIPTAQIKKWIRQDRLMLSMATGDIDCISCGKSIRSGKYCADCKAKLIKGFESGIKKESTVNKKDKLKKNDRIRFR